MTVTPMCSTNSIVHFQRAMYQVLKDHWPKHAEAFVDDIGIKGALVQNETELKPGVQHFVWEHLVHVEMILNDLEKAILTLSGKKNHILRWRL